MKENFTDITRFGKIQKLKSSFNSPRIKPESGVHPRLMFRAEDLEVIRANLEAPENSYACEEYKKLVATECDGVIKGELSYDEIGKILTTIESKAFEYALNGDPVVGCDAINAIANVMLTATYSHIPDSSRPMGQVMMTAAEVYDWCYDLMTDEIKAAFVAACESIVTPGMEMGFPPAKQEQPISGHGSEGQVLRDWLAFAIATYDEYPDIYEFVAGEIFDKFVPVRDYYYKSGAIHQGSNYGPYRFNFDLWSAWLFKRMSGEMIYDESMAKVMYAFIYGLRPDGELLRVGDDSNERRLPYDMIDYKITSFYAANLFGDEVIKGESKRLLDDYSAINWCNNTLTPAQYLIFNDTELKTKPLSELPLTYYMGSPLGETITRTGWDINHSDDILVMMKIGEHNGMNHDHLDSGNFQIYYKGILASESGVYDLYFTPEDKNYNKTTVAHNCLLIFDPDEDTSGRANCGGERYVDLTGNLDLWLNDKKYRFGKVTAHEETDTHVILTGDITLAYTNKVSEVLRSMTFIPTGDAEMPGIFAVYDRVTAANASFKKTFQLHMQTEPEVDGNTTVITNKGGKLVNQTLLPNDAVITKVGGEGNEFNINGVNYPSTMMKDENNSLEAGWGRVEISPVAENLSDSFLNVMYVTDEDSAIDAKSELIESDSAVGARLGDYAMVFAKSTERAEKISFTIPGDGSVKLLVVGLAGGEYEVGGKVCTATEDGGSIWIETDAGSVDLVKK